MNYLASPPLSWPTRWPARWTSTSTTSRSARTPTARPCTCATSGRSEHEVARADRARRSSRTCSASSYGEVFDGDERWTRSTSPRATSSPGTTTRPTCASRRSSRACDAEPEPARGHRGRPRAGAARRQRHHRPHLPRRLDQEGPPAGRYLLEHGVKPEDFNSYGSRRGNHEVMMRGTFANIRLRNLLAPGTEGGVTIHLPDGEQMSIYDAAMRYAEEGTPLVVLAGKEYGSGSSRDWAAKGTMLLGVRGGASPRASSASTAPTSSAWACCRSSSPTARRPSRWASPARRRSRSAGSTAARPREVTVKARRQGVHRPRAHRHAQGSRLLPPRRDPAVRAAPARRRELDAL